MRLIIKNLYQHLRSVSPPRLNGILSKLVFRHTQKPIVKKDNIPPSKKFPNNEQGGMIISADFEMSWAWRYTKTGADYLKKGTLERKNIPHIIKLLEDYNIPITFATVGHLLLESCEAEDHTWMKRIPHFDDHWKFTSGDWYDHDPCSNYNDAPQWYAADLIDKILDSKVEHEIGSHTFSHIDFSYKNCPPTVAEDEIKACISAAEKRNIQPESMVFPGGTWGNIETLKKYGFSIYRKRTAFELAYPWRDKQGLLVSDSSGSLEYNLNYGWTPQYYISRLKKYLDKAIDSNTIAHLWFHPSLDPYILENVLPDFLDYADGLRKEGLLWVGTMKAIADHINKNNIL